MSSYPVYYSIHDTVNDFETLLVTGFNLSLAIASVSAHTLVYLSGSPILPIIPIDPGAQLDFMANDLKDNFMDIFNEEKVSLDKLYRVIAIFNSSAYKFMQHVTELDSFTIEIHLRRMNKSLLSLTEAF